METEHPSGTPSQTGLSLALPQITTAVLAGLTVVSVSVLRPYIPTGCFDVCITLSPTAEATLAVVALLPVFGLLGLECASAFLASRRPRLALRLSVAAAPLAVVFVAYVPPETTHPYSVALATATAGLGLITPGLVALGSSGRIRRGAMPSTIAAAVAFLMQVGETARSGVVIPPGAFDRVTAILVLAVTLVALALQSANTLSHGAAGPTALWLAVWATLAFVLLGEFSFLFDTAVQSHLDPLQTWLLRPWNFTH